MSGAIEYIKRKVEEFNGWIKNDISIYSGKASNSLRVESDNNSVKSIGSDYIEILNRGSRPWSNPKETFKKLAYHLKDWASSKRLNPFAVAWNIAHFGNQIFQGKKKGLQIEKKVEKLQNELKQELPKYAKTDILQVLNKFNNQYLSKSI